MTTRLPALLACAVFLVAGCSTQPASHMHESSGGATASAPVRFDDLAGEIAVRGGDADVAVTHLAEAEAVYREDLCRNPENGWSLFRLAQSLGAQDKSADAAAVDERFRRASARADVTLTASRF